MPKVDGSGVSTPRHRIPKVTARRRPKTLRMLVGDKSEIKIV
jgi:hypothetical protein